jgi:cytochrome oxidase assembly protein ShyY1
MTLFVVVLLPLVVGLGFWQLDRAEQKLRFEERVLDSIGALPVSPGASVRDFERLKLSGHYEPEKTFLLDNQTHGGAVGYDVVTSFVGADGRRWLVNRGFLAGDPARRSLPRISTPSGMVTLIGLVWPDLGLLPVYGDNAWADGWPKLVQRLEVERMAGYLDNAVPREIRLEDAQPGVFVPAPTTLNMPATRHTGYAVQWFGLGVALIAGYLFFGFRRGA